MVFGHGANINLFNKQNKDWTIRTLATPYATTSDNISSFPHLLKVDVIWVSQYTPYFKVT